jgi:hypothetical protein
MYVRIDDLIIVFIFDFFGSQGLRMYMGTKRYDILSNSKFTCLMIIWLKCNLNICSYEII